MNLERIGVVPRRDVRSLFRDQRTENHLVRLEIDAMQCANGHFKRSPPSISSTVYHFSQFATSVLPQSYRSSRILRPAADLVERPPGHQQLLLMQEVVSIQVR